jgi:hypothetical protein
MRNEDKKKSEIKLVKYIACIYKYDSTTLDTNVCAISRFDCGTFFLLRPNHKEQQLCD